MRQRFTKVASLGLAQAAGAAAGPAAGDGDRSRPRNRSRGRNRRDRARCGPAAVGTGIGEVGHSPVERVCGALPPAGVSAAVRGAPALLPGGERGASPGVFVVCGGRLGTGRAGPLDWLERPRSSTEVELGGGELALCFVSLGAHQEFGQQSVVAGRQADPQRLAAEVRICAGVAGDVRRAGAVSGHLLSGGQLDSPGSDARRRAHGPSQSVSLGAARDLCVSVSRGLSIVSAKEERWSNPAVSSDGEKS